MLKIRLLDLFYLLNTVFFSSNFCHMFCMHIATSNTAVDKSYVVSTDQI